MYRCIELHLLGERDGLVKDNIDLMLHIGLVAFFNHLVNSEDTDEESVEIDIEVSMRSWFSFFLNINFSWIKYEQRYKFTHFNVLSQTYIYHKTTQVYLWKVEQPILFFKSCLQ